MNATEQRSHKRATDSLDQRLSDVETVVDRLMKNSEWLHRELTQLQLDFALVRDRFQPLVDELHVAERSHSDTHRAFAGFCDRGFSARWRWLLRGR